MRLKTYLIHKNEQLKSSCKLQKSALDILIKKRKTALLRILICI